MKPHFSLILSILTALGMAFFGSACNRNNSDSNNANSSPPSQAWPGGWGGSGCTNCGMSGGVGLVQAKAASGSESILFTLNVVGSGQGYNQWATNAVVGYSGPVMIDGAMRVMQSDSFLCNAPPGDYQVRTIQAGSMSMGMLSNLRLEAVGPVRMTFNLPQASLWGISFSVPDPRLNMMLYMESINNQRCSTGILQTW